METALKTLNFGPEALWITLGTLVAMAALALLALQLVSHIRALRQTGWPTTSISMSSFVPTMIGCLPWSGRRPVRKRS